MFFCLIFDGHLRTYTAQATASMRGLRRETPGRTARRATLQARHTRIQVVNSLITGGAIIYVDMSSLANLREWRAGTGQIDVCDYLCSRRNERGMRETP
jgi:hypothetical protein